MWKQATALGLVLTSMSCGNQVSDGALSRTDANEALYQRQAKPEEVKIELLLKDQRKAETKEVKAALPVSQQLNQGPAIPGLDVPNMPISSCENNSQFAFQGCQLPTQFPTQLPLQSTDPWYVYGAGGSYYPFFDQYFSGSFIEDYGHRYHRDRDDDDGDDRDDDDEDETEIE